MGEISAALPDAIHQTNGSLSAMDSDECLSAQSGFFKGQPSQPSIIWLIWLWRSRKLPALAAPFGMSNLTHVASLLQVSAYA